MKIIVCFHNGGSFTADLPPTDKPAAESLRQRWAAGERGPLDLVFTNAQFEGRFEDIADIEVAS